MAAKLLHSAMIRLAIPRGPRELYFLSTGGPSGQEPSRSQETASLSSLDPWSSLEKQHNEVNILPSTISLLGLLLLATAAAAAAAAMPSLLTHGHYDASLARRGNWTTGGIGNGDETIVDLGDSLYRSVTNDALNQVWWNGIRFTASTGATQQVAASPSFRRGQESDCDCGVVLR